MTERWWAKGNDPEGGPDAKAAPSGGGMEESIRHGMGIGFVTIAEGTLYPFMLSSAFTARNYSHIDKEEVEIDVIWAFIISLVTGAIIAYFLKSNVTFLYAIGLGAVLSLVYLIRGGLLQLPFHVPGLTLTGGGER